MVYKVQNYHWPVGKEKNGETTAQAIIVESVELLWGQAEFDWVMTGSPLSQAIEWFSGKQQVLDQDEQAMGDRNFLSAIVGGQVCLEDLFEMHALEEVIEDGQCSHGVRAQDSLG